MPIHDWTRVPDETFHDFHLAWITEICNALNGGVLPRSYSAQAERSDCVRGGAAREPGGEARQHGSALQAVAPRSRFEAVAELGSYFPRRPIVIRHANNSRVVGRLEIVAPANKAGDVGLGAFAGTAVESLFHGFHLLIVDLFPPTPRDPSGVHGAIWSEISDEPFELPPGEPLTLVSYSAGPIKRAYIEPTAVGRDLIDMPLFLEPDIYVNVPLEATYRAAYRGVPQRWKRVLEG